MKIRLFALARELGLDSKVLIELADEAGVKLRNALATITPEEKEQIVAYAKNRGGGGGAVAAKAEPEEELAPVREEASSAGKVREIRSMTPRPQHGDAPHSISDPVSEVTADEVTAGEVTAGEVTADEVTADEVTADEVTADEVTADEVTADDAASSLEDDDAGSLATAGEAEESGAETGAGVESSGEESPDESQPSRPVRRTTVHRMRPMTPIGSVKDRGDTESEEDKDSVEQPAPQDANDDGRRPGPVSRPVVAAPPSYTPPVVRKQKKAPDEKAMKPDIALDIDRASPLADQLKHIKQVRADHEGAGIGRRGAKRGSLLKELNQARREQRQKKQLRNRRSKRAPAALKTSAQIELPITVRTLSEAIGRPAKDIVGLMFKEGRMATINDELSEDDALELALELGVDLDIKRGRDIEAELLAAIDHEDVEETLQPRPAVITILGHVDHGKTTLIDRLRRSNVAAGEAGGITQHIAAYQVDHSGQRITFVDTPGHAAFGEMRSRGANVTDIIVLVIAADDGVMPQTEECISHAKNAGVPIVVALNKMDLPGVDDQKALQQLAQHELLPAEWGGEIEVVRTSGETGTGVDDLLETLLLTSELHDYRTNPDRDAIGVCLESFRDEGRGVLAWLIVKKGTLRVGDNVLCGTSFGRIRAMYDDNDQPVEEAGPSTPVRVAGLDSVPGAGVHFFVMKDIEEARAVAESREDEGRSKSLSGRGQAKTIEDILNAAREGEGIQELPLILKADTPGSIEALRGELEKFEHPEVKINIIHDAVGGVNESDVYLASAAGAIIVAFHVIAEDRAETVAEQEGVEIRRYDIIYEVTEHIRMALEGLLRPERVEVATGRAIVLRTFQISRFGTIAGCRVLNGTINRDSQIHVIRDQTVLNSYRIGSLKREKDDAKEVRDGMECGIRLDGFNDIKEGDLLEAFRVDEIQRTLADSK